MNTPVIVLSAAIIIETLALAMFGGRILHDAQKKQRCETYAIQNAETAMDIRVFNAGVPDETPIILYPHHSWECMTWQKIEQEDDSCLLKNLYTEKGIEASSAPKNGASLWQQPLSAKDSQSWIFEQDGDKYRLRLKNTDLYVTAKSEKTNASLVLAPHSADKKQLWMLIAQSPIV